MAAEVAPDVAGTVEGWRCWTVHRHLGNMLLSSVYYPSVWQPGRAARAVCRIHRGLDGEPRHDAPDPECRCGIYAAGRQEHVEEIICRLASATGGALVRSVVYGRVRLWGHVIEHDRGWRGENAYPAEIIIPEWFSFTPWPLRAERGEDRARAVNALARYRAPVTVLA